MELTFVLHLPHVMLHHIWDYKVCSCQVIKVCMKVLLFIKHVPSQRPVIQGATVKIYGYSVARVCETILHSSSPQRAIYHAAIFLI